MLRKLKIFSIPRSREIWVMKSCGKDTLKTSVALKTFSQFATVGFFRVIYKWCSMIIENAVTISPVVG